MDKELLIKECEKSAKEIRKDCIRMTYSMGNIGAHIGGSMSLAEIMSVLYKGFIKIDPADPEADDRDRMIMSKGHGAMAMYAGMKQAGIITDDELMTYKKEGTFLYAHPSMNKEHGIEFSSGSLGQGLSLGVGVCLGLMRKGNEDSRVYVILGDGECDEGSVWESAQSAAHFGCKNLVAIVDANKLQYDGTTDEIMKIEPMEGKWQSFGWDAVTCDGHDCGELIEALSKTHDKPLAVIANTVKGKGVSYMENNPLWHNHNITEQQYNQAMEELENA